MKYRVFIAVFLIVSLLACMASAFCVYAEGESADGDTVRSLPVDNHDERLRLVIIILISTVVLIEIGAALVVMRIKRIRDKEKTEKEIERLRTGDKDTPADPK